MRARAVELLSVTGVATVITVAMAFPVLLSPSTRLFGRELVGRHHDPFTVMRQFASPGVMTAYTQPVTDVAGSIWAWLAGPVIAYNAVVLVSFPLSAAAAYLLARYLALSRPAATAAALAYAFAPFHVAHGAYHPHVAQTQWLPLYFLALWRCVDRATPVRILLLVNAVVAATLSNFYGGLVAAVLTPLAILVHWPRAREAGARLRDVAATAITLAGLAAAAGAYVVWAAPGVLASPSALAVPRSDLFLYSAKWWSYLLPPAANPLLGAWAQHVWEQAGIREGLLEQQVSLGWGIVALGAIAVIAWRRRSAAPFAAVPGLLALAVFAAVCSLSPERTIAGITVTRPSALMYHVVPMFRSYARFGMAVQLAAALLAGLGADALLRASSARARWSCVALLTLTAAEYMTWPSAGWRDVLPTRAHRWVMQQPEGIRALDCSPLDSESASVLWLTRSRVALLDDKTNDCTEPNLPGKLAAQGYTHLLVRRGNRAGRAFFDGPLAPELRPVNQFRDAQIFQVVAQPSPVYTAAMSGFWPREQGGGRTWRWMQRAPAWTIVNGTSERAAASLDVELWAAGRARRVDLELDGQLVRSFDVAVDWRAYSAGMTLTPGAHRLMFVVDAAVPATADGDPRALLCAVGDWTWTSGSRPE